MKDRFEKRFAVFLNKGFILFLLFSFIITNSLSCGPSQSFSIRSTDFELQPVSIKFEGEAWIFPHIENILKEESFKNIKLVREGNADYTIRFFESHSVVKREKRKKSKSDFYFNPSASLESFPEENGNEWGLSHGSNSYDDDPYSEPNEKEQKEEAEDAIFTMGFFLSIIALYGIYVYAGLPLIYSVKEQMNTDLFDRNGKKIAYFQKISSKRGFTNHYRKKKSKAKGRQKVREETLPILLISALFFINGVQSASPIENPIE